MATSTRAHDVGNHVPRLEAPLDLQLALIHTALLARRRADIAAHIGMGAAYGVVIMTLAAT